VIDARSLAPRRPHLLALLGRSRRPHPLLLLARSRRLGPWLVTSAVVTAGFWALSLPWDDSSTSRALGLYAVAGITTAAGSTLAGPDLDLDRTAARAWHRLRLGHLLLIAAVALGCTTAVALTGSAFAPWEVLARNAAGFTGLAALGTVALGAGRAWSLPVIVAAVVPYVSFQVGPDPDAWLQALLFCVQPPSSTAAGWAAGLLALSGAAAYTLRGPRH
jgi:hypothetical protein